MTCEKLIARLVAIADERPNAPIGHVVEHELPELRAQAEAMPRIVREGRDFDVRFHDNGAATSRKDGTRSDGKSALESAAAAAPPSAAQPVAWMYQHEETGNVNFRPHNERWADHRRYVEIPLYTAPPDLARVTAERDAIAELNQAQFLALENCRLLAARNRNEGWAQNILRFCDGAGVRAVTMRQVKAALAKGE